MLRVLLVDDEPSIRLTMAEFLKRAGYTVISVADFESASMLGSAGFDVAVVDINLPGRSGIELLEVINNRDPYVPVIMITGEPSLSAVPKIVRAGAYDFIAKPVVKDVLLRAVERAAEKKHLTDEKWRLELEIKQYAEELELRVAERTAELIEAHERLAHNEKIAALGQVAAQVAHEVRNPLSGLLLYAVHLKSRVGSTLPESELELVDKIIETINHLAKTVEQVMEFARPIRLSQRALDLNVIVSDVIQLAKPQLDAGGVEMEVLLEEAGATAKLDESSMRAALMNLILNAVEAMPDGGRLNVMTRADGERVRLRIADTGVGMNSEQLKKVFEPFYTTKRKGLGLGMAYVRRIVEQHEGRISVQSQPGEGVVIEIDVPAPVAVGAAGS
jgi:signal transduction histidine kinase